jgi:hypothetical protein
MRGDGGKSALQLHQGERKESYETISVNNLYLLGSRSLDAIRRTGAGTGRSEVVVR